jgi:hypothetical protein
MTHFPERASTWLAVASALLTVPVLLAAPGLGSAADSEPAAAPVKERPRLQVSVETPEENAVVGDPGGMAFLAGKALAHFGEFATFDIMFVIDQSESTSSPSGADVNGDGEVDERTCGNVPPMLGLFGSIVGACRSSKDSILAAELLAVRTLLKQLDPRTTQVGVVAFSGDGDPLTADAYVASPLTTEYEKVERALEEIEDLGPQGRTNMQAGVQVATLELIGSQSAYSKPQEGAAKIMLFLSDGMPTLPLEQSMHQNRRLAIEAATKAAKFNIRIDTYGIGPEALSQPVVVVEMARVSDGIFTPVMQPRDLQSIFESVNFSDIQQLRIRNKTNNRDAEYTLRNADGTFSALLEMVEGPNAVEVYARSTDGTEQTRVVNLKFLSDADVQALSPALLAQRNRLMANRLADLREKSLAVEAQRDEEVRRDLQIRIKEEREKAEERARAVRIEEERERTRDVKSSDVKEGPKEGARDPKNGSGDAAPAPRR